MVAYYHANCASLLADAYSSCAMCIRNQGFSSHSLLPVVPPCSSKHCKMYSINAPNVQYKFNMYRKITHCTV